jgi:uncharacterized protein YaeQ
MALTATLYHWQVALSDIDRGVYEALDLRLARHPSESMRYLLTRTLAYCLCYEDGIRFSKAGLSAAEEPPVAVYDPTGRLLSWIDIGTPTAERLHKATKAAAKVALFTHSDLLALKREVRTRPIHRAQEIALWRIEPRFLEDLETAVENLGRRSAQMECMLSDGQLYFTVGGATISTPLCSGPLHEALA